MRISRLLRKLTPPPLVPPGVSQNQRYLEKCVLGYTPAEVYAVVADVKKYPEFLPWCTNSVIHKDSPTEMEATLQIGFMYFNEKYTSRVQLVHPIQIDAILTGDSTVLKSLSCNWRFAKNPSVANTTMVHFGVQFCFHNPVHTTLSGFFLSQIVEKMTRSFEQRCEVIYGAPQCARISYPTEAQLPNL